LIEKKDPVASIMIKKLDLSKVFFGWWMVIATGLIAFLGVGFVAYGFSVIFKPLSAELGLSRAVTSLATSIQNLGYGIVGPLGGWVADRYSPKWVILAGIFFMVVGCILMFFVNSLWSLLVVWGILIGIGYSLGFTVITDKAIVNWFVKKSGIALNLKFGIQVVSGMILLPAVAWLITRLDWRWACLIVGIAIAVICFPLAWFFIKPNRPEYYGLTPDGLPADKPASSGNIAGEKSPPQKVLGPQFTLKQALKTPTFWLMICLFYISNLAAPIMNVHCVPFLTDMGIPPLQAASMMSIWLTCSIPARIIVGFIVDRLKLGQLRFLMMTGYFLQAIGVALFLFTKSQATIYVWFVLFGIGSGISAAPFITMLADYFGRKAFGAVIGSILLIMLPVTLSAPVYVGWIFDSTGSYSSVFNVFASLLVASGLISYFIMPPKAPKTLEPASGHSG
jgi:MFS family permease